MPGTNSGHRSDGQLGGSVTKSRLPSQCPLWNRQPVIWAVHGVLRVIQDRASAAIAHTAWPRVQNFPAITAPEPSNQFHHRYRGRGILGSGHCITANQYNCGSLQPMACSRASDPDLPGVRLLQNGNQRATPPPPLGGFAAP